MLCLHPKIVHGELFPCQKCPVCQQNKRQALTDRFILATAFARSSFFLTLTYSDDHLYMAGESNDNDPEFYEPCFWPQHIKNFLQNLDRKGYIFSYFLTCEYGEDYNRPHYHLLCWFDSYVPPLEFYNAVDDSWHYGFAQHSLVSDRRCAYCAKYALKEDIRHLGLPRYDLRRPFTKFSRSPAVGASAIAWLQDYIENGGTYRTSIFWKGRSIQLDNYFKKHIWDVIYENYSKLRSQKNDYDMYQYELALSRRRNSNLTSSGFVNDYSKDFEILKSREKVKQMKKLIR